MPRQLAVGPFLHPERGLVRCSATAVLMASLRRTGHRAVRASRPCEADPDTPDGVLFTASYLDRDGRAVGFCVAAHASDEAGLRAARDVVNTWSTVWRTRRAVVAPASARCHDDARQPCRHVTIARAEMRVFAELGEQIVVIGQHGHAALAELLHDMPGDVVVVGPDDNVGRIRLDPDRAAYVVQPGILVEDAARVVAALRAHHPGIRGAHPDGLCYAASDHAAAVGVVMASCDVTFVLGEVAPPAVSAAEKTQVHVLDDVARIRPAWIAGAASIGIVPTASAPQGLYHDLLDLLSGLGPLSVAHRRLTTEVLPARRRHRTPAQRPTASSEPSPHADVENRGASASETSSEGCLRTPPLNVA